MENFELAGPTWLNLTCLLVAALVFLPLGVWLAREGLSKRRWRDVALGVAVAGFMLVCVVWMPLEGPARLTLTESELVLDYRWPRPDQRVAIRSVTGVDYHTTRYRGRRGTPRSQTELRVSLEAGDPVRIRPPGARANWDNLRAAGVALANRANVRLDETVVDNR